MTGIPLSVAMLILAAALLMGWRADAWYAARLVIEERQHVQQELTPYGNNLNAAILHRFALLEGLAAFVHAHPTDAELRGRFETFAAGLYTGSHGIRALQAFPRSVPEYVYPARGNEAVIGGSLNRLLHDERPLVREDVQRTIRRRQLAFSDPYELRQGGLGLVARRAVYHNDTFWGLVTIILDLPPLLEEIDRWRAAGNLNLALRDRSGKCFWGDCLLENDAPIIYRLGLLDGEWEMAAWPKTGWGSLSGWKQSLFRTTMGLLAVLLIALIYAVLQYQRRLEGAVRSRTTDLEESEDRYRRLFEANSDALFLLDESGRILDANPIAVDRYGYGREELKQMHALDLSPPENRAHGKQNIRKALEDKISFRWRHQVKGGPNLPVEINAGPLQLNQRRCILACVRDISKRIQSEERLRQSEARLQQTFEAAPFPIAVSSQASGLILFCNKSFRETFWPLGVNPVGQPVTRIYVDPEDRRRAIGMMAENDVIKHFETRMRTADGEIRWVMLSLSRMVFEEQAALFGSVADITDMKRMAEEKHVMELQLRQHQKLESIGTLAGGVAHEINNPINGIMNYARLIDERLEDGSPLHEYAREIETETQRVADIVRNLLTFARQERRSRSPARVADIVASTLSLVRTIIRNDQIELEVDVPGDLPEINCRSQQIQQVLMNLLTNARDALNEKFKGHHSDKRIALGASAMMQQGRPWIRLTVSDRGTGIRSEDARRMFDPFFTTKPKDRGTGLGLSISYGIIRDHNGKLICDTTPGEGTTFTVELPVDSTRETDREGGDRVREAGSPSVAGQHRT